MKTETSTRASFKSQSFLQDFIGLKKLWPFVRPDRKFIIISSILIPLIGVTQTIIPLLLKSAIDHGILTKDSHHLVFCGIAFLVIVILDYFFRSGQALATATAVHRSIRRLRRTSTLHVMMLSASFHDRNLSGALTTRLTSDIDNLSESLNQGVLNSIVDFIALAGCLVGMAILDWKLTLIALAFLPLIQWIVSWFSRAMKDALIEARKKSAIANGFSQECINALTTIRLLNAQLFAREKYRTYTYEFRDAQMRSVVLDSLLFAILDGVSSIALGLVLYLTLRHVGMFSELSAGVMVAFALYIQQVFEPLKQLSNKIAMLQGAFASVERVFSLLENKDKIGGDVEPHFKNDFSIQFDHVSFSYSENGRTILKEISFNAKSGATTALVGKTGSGKSSIIKLLLKIYSGYSGSIRIGGQDLKPLNPTQLRKHIGVVPQDVVLFDGSIAFNIGLDRPDVTREMIVEATRKVHAHSFIEKLPGGYDFVVKERGANLSHGQRQLLVFARAIVRNPSFLILDEATSSVDPESELLIQRGTEELFRNRTVIVIAHRLSTIQKADQILVCKEGKLVERGNHEQLLNQNSEYAHLIAISEKAHTKKAEIVI